MAERMVHGVRLEGNPKQYRGTIAGEDIVVRNVGGRMKWRATLARRSSHFSQAETLEGCVEEMIRLLQDDGNEGNQ
jgi:hypothetical protein